jgi:hypothetical protein
MFCAYEQFPYSTVSAVKSAFSTVAAAAGSESLSLNLTMLKKKSQGKSFEPEELTNETKLQVCLLLMNPHKFFCFVLTRAPLSSKIFHILMLCEQDACLQYSGEDSAIKITSPKVTPWSDHSLTVTMHTETQSAWASQPRYCSLDDRVLLLLDILGQNRFWSLV